MLAFLTTCPFYDWGENWPAGFQEENVNHGLAGLMTPCLSLMLISVNWGPCSVLEGFGKSLRTVELSMLPLLLLTPEQKHLCADGVSLFALHSLSEPICFHHNDSHSLGLIFTVIQGVSFFLVVVVGFDAPTSFYPKSELRCFWICILNPQRIRRYQTVVLAWAATLPCLTHPYGVS